MAGKPVRTDQKSGPKLIRSIEECQDLASLKGECAENFVIDVASQTLFESLVILDVLHRKVLRASVFIKIQLENCVCCYVFMWIELKFLIFVFV